jgi:hypothetical protein
MLDAAVVGIVATMASLVGVPILIGLAVIGWVNCTRANLPHWRNIVGLASLVLVVLSWLWRCYTLIGNPTRLSLFLELCEIASLCTLLAVFLAFAWKGTPRIQALGASLLMLLSFLFLGFMTLQLRPFD